MKVIPSFICVAVLVFAIYSLLVTASMFPRIDNPEYSWWYLPASIWHTIIYTLVIGVASIRLFDYLVEDFRNRKKDLP